jgi:hypothetical protein
MISRSVVTRVGGGVQGFASVTHAAVVSGNTRIDFVLPRTASTMYPNIARTW